MLPSMPILFSRESQDAFGNKIEPSTSFFSQNSAPKPVISPEPPPAKPQEPPKTQKEVKTKSEPEKKKKNDLPINENALENALVKSYYARVQQRFSSHPSLPTNKFTQFQTLLREFNPTKETPVDLYKKVENLFGSEHKDMVEDFLLFLKPGQAAQVGRFMDRFSLVRMTGFLDLLHKTFARKPTVLRKVIRALTAGLDTGNSAQARSMVLPHFRAHPPLIQMFRSLFPDERPEESAYETGTDIINESFLTSDRGCDVWEFADDDTTKRKLDANENLDTLYLNGRVFLQHGRLLRSARITFPYSKEPYRDHVRRLAPAHCHLSPPDSDDETNKKNTKPQKRPRKPRSPTKKDVNDNTRKDKDVVMNPKPKKAQKPKTTKKEPEVKDTPKRERKDSKNTKKESIETNAVVKKDPLEPPKVKQPKIEAPIQNVKVKEPIEAQKPKQKLANIEATVSVKTKPIEKVNSWTRDEDKTMLQVLKCEAGSEKVFGRIRELLPHRSETEIKDRFCHVMTLLQQMAVGEVT